MNYPEYLHSDHWLDTRDQKLSDIDYCEGCGHGKGLEVHHLTYENIGTESMEDLQVLCSLCHRRTHELIPSAKDFKRAGGGTLYGWETQRYGKENR